jgi:hypothetical protein
MFCTCVCCCGVVLFVRFSEVVEELVHLSSVKVGVVLCNDLVLCDSGVSQKK